MTDPEVKEPEPNGNGAAQDKPVEQPMGEDPSAREAAPEPSGEAAPQAGEVAPTAPPPDPVAEARAETARMRDQLLRTAADFDNFRKRTRKELIDAEQRGRDELLRDLLPVFDNLERAVQHADGATDVGAVADGIRMVMRQFLDTLGKMSVHRIPAVGTAFDPAVHEAIQHLESTEPPGTVVAEVQAGYKAGDRLVRPALVVVAKAPVVQPPVAEPPREAEGDDRSSEGGPEDG